MYETPSRTMRARCTLRRCVSCRMLFVHTAIASVHKKWLTLRSNGNFHFTVLERVHPIKNMLFLGYDEVGAAV